MRGLPVLPWRVVLCSVRRRHFLCLLSFAHAPRARSGNWLPTGGVERYVLVLRFYDTPVGIATRAEREAPMPAIKSPGRCQ